MRRTYGIENEYAVIPADMEQCIPAALAKDKHGTIQFIESAMMSVIYHGYNSTNLQLMPEGVDSDNGFEGHFKTNGLRAYVDVGHHPEISDQETFSALGMTLCHFANIRYMTAKSHLVRQYITEIHNQRDNVLRCNRISKGEIDFLLLRQVNDGIGNTWGHHLNLSSKKELYPNQKSLAPLLLAMIGGSALFGGGYVDEEGDFGVFQKSQNIMALVHGSTTQIRPLVNVRNEPHADPEKYRRQHIVGCDPVSVYPTWLRGGMFELCVQLCEERPEVASRMSQLLVDDRQPPTNLPPNMWLNRVLGVFNQDPHNQATVTMANGRDMSQAAILKEVLDEVKPMVEQESSGVELHAEHELVVQEWEQAIEDLQTHNPDMEEFYDDKRRYKIVESARARGKSASTLRRTDAQMNDISDHNANKLAKTKAYFQGQLESNGWERLAKLYDIDQAKLEAVAQEYVKCPVGRSLWRGRDIRHKNVTNADYEVWVYKEEDTSYWGPDERKYRKYVYDADIDVGDHYDPLERIAA